MNLTFIWLTLFVGQPNDSTHGVWLTGERTMVAAWHERGRLCVGIWLDRSWKHTPELGCDYSISIHRNFGRELDGLQIYNGRERRIEAWINKMLDKGGS